MTGETCPVCGGELKVPSPAFDGLFCPHCPYRQDLDGGRVETPSGPHGDWFYGHYVVRRPPRYAEATVDPADYDDIVDIVRFECLRCGLTPQGHGQAVNEALAREPCPAPEGVVPR